MKRAIIMDSSCDISINGDFENQIYMEKVPLKLRVGEDEYIDDDNLDLVSFMRKMSECAEATGTAAPSPEEWYNAYKKADEIIVDLNKFNNQEKAVKSRLIMHIITFL